ncbi:MAG TPA: DUF2950 family protein [Planctomycetota bacterium]|jgi:hypothetical protein
MRTRRLVLVPLVLCGLLARAEDNIEANEIAAGACTKAFAEAEEIYHRTDYNADGVLEYAQSLRGGARAPAVVQPAKLPQPSDEEKQQIAKLIKGLGADEFSAREAAAKELGNVGPKAYGQLQAAQSSEKDVEIVSRCRKLAEQIAQAQAPALSPAMRYGLYSSSTDGDLMLIEKSFAEAECPPGADPATVPAHKGYLFRILTAQGPSALGGARNYISNGRMTLGYALLSFPKEYGKTGKKCFLINNNGTIYMRDFGSKEKTEAFVKGCTLFDPKPDEWVPTE